MIWRVHAFQRAHFHTVFIRVGTAPVIHAGPACGAKEMFGGLCTPFIERQPVRTSYHVQPVPGRHSRQGRRACGRTNNCSVRAIGQFNLKRDCAAMAGGFDHLRVTFGILELE